MNACRCGAGPLSGITFAGGVEMLRCRRCGETSWTLDGRPVDHTAAHGALRGTFVATRRQVTSPRAPRPPRVLDLREPSSPTPPPPPPVEAAEPTEAEVTAALTELLRSKGIGGSWQVTGR